MARHFRSSAWFDIMDKLKSIYDRIQTFQVEEHYEPNDIIKILNIMGDLVDELRNIEAGNKRTADSASCLANGIQPD